MGQGGVAVPLLGLGPGDHPVGVQLRVPGLGPQELAHLPSGVAGGRQQPVGNHEGTGVDERVARNAAFGLQLDQ
jgi:hypothetical protein